MRLPRDVIIHIDTEVKNGKANIMPEWEGELVRCKDCKFSAKAYPLLCRNGKALALIENENNFCSYGERSEE